MTPKVSVAMITYNHRPYVAQAIESVLDQQTDFPIELVIGEDASPDGTGEIVRAYQKKHPDIIRAICRTKNVGAQENIVSVLEACLGEYLAFLEGDDYWTSPHKLKKQIEVLDASKSKVGCFHLVQVVDRDGQPATTEATRPEYHRELTTIDLMECDPIPTCSVVLRRSALPNLAPEFDSLVMRDWPMWIFASLKGPFAFIPDRMGAYRCHPTSIWTSKDYAYRLLAQIRLFDLLCVTLPSPYREVAVARLAKLKNHYALIQVEEGNRSEALQQANEAIGLLPHLLLSPGLSIFIKQQLAIRSPRLHGALVNAKDLCRKLLVKSGLRRAGLLP